MATMAASNSRKHFYETVSDHRSSEEKALDFFRRADTSEPAGKIGAIDRFRSLEDHHQSIEQNALDFFQRAEISERLETIWEFIKHQRFGTIIRLVKAVAAITAAIVLVQSVSFTGLLSLAGSIVGLLFAAITNAYAWFIYIPLYFVSPNDFASSAMLAIGLAWLGGLNPFVALVVSPIALIGSRFFERAPVAQARVSELPGAMGKALDSVNLGATFQQAAGNVASFVGVIPRRVAKAALLPAKLYIPIKA